MKTCIFCQLQQEGLATIISDHAEFFVIPDKYPQSPFHALLITKQHYPNMLSVPNNLLQDIITEAKNILIQKNITHFKIVHNGGKKADIHHFHMHIMGNLE